MSYRLHSQDPKHQCGECNIDNMLVNAPKITMDQTITRPFYDYTLLIPDHQITVRLNAKRRLARRQPSLTINSTPSTEKLYSHFDDTV